MDEEEFWGEGLSAFLKREIKTNITLFYAPVSLLMYVFITANTFGILWTLLSYTGLKQWIKGKTVTKKCNLYLVGLQKG